MGKHAHYQDVILKKQQLHTISESLKAHFIGLDSVIDEIMGLLSSWYFFPQAQLRPLVINLWGMTGSGKTALVQKLVELLEYQKLYLQVDMGEFESDSATWLKNVLTEDMTHLHKKACVLCLDEFQFARTINQNGEEMGKDKLRFVWDLVDNGKLTYIPTDDAYRVIRGENALRTLEKALLAGVQVENGVVTGNLEIFTQLFRNVVVNTYGNKPNEPKDAQYFLSDDFVDGVYYLFANDDIEKEAIKARIASSDLIGLVALVQEALKTRTATRELDLSKSLIFILGNLDEAYGMSKSMNPDISADELHEATLRINLTHIKSALKKRFRAEQIARLGNNHVLYRAFKNVHFEELIRRELLRVGSFIREEFGFQIRFHESVHELIYEEGVFPAQGTRPVLTTVKNCVEAWFGKVVFTAIEQPLPVATVEWLYDNQHYRFVYKDATNTVLCVREEKVQLKVNPLRKHHNRNLQAHTAVHEAGHAVLAVMTLRILPSVVVSRSASSDAEGFCMVNLPEGLTTREVLHKDIVISLGGYLAEKLIFGEAHTSSGVSEDIEIATQLANMAVRQYAMGSDPVLVKTYSSDNELTFYTEEKHREEAMRIIRDCESEAEALLGNYRYLLLKIAEYLTDHYKMDEETLATYVRMYSGESWPVTEGFKTKENYFAFESVLRGKLAEQERFLRQPA